MLVGGITKFHHPFMGGSQNSRGLKWGESQNSLWMRFTTLIFTHPRKKRLRLRLFSCYVTLIFNNSLISNELVDALKSSEFPWLRHLAFFSLLWNKCRPAVMGGDHEIKAPSNRGDHRFPCRFDRGITEYRRWILPNMSIPSPVVNDMSLSYFFMFWWCNALEMQDAPIALTHSQYTSLKELCL